MALSSSGIRSGALAVMVALAFPVAAHGYSQAERDRIAWVAAAQWPLSQCRGREVVRPISAAELDAEHPEMNGTAGAQAVMDGSCTVQVGWDRMDSWNAPAAGECAVLVHEFGHLSGLGHSTDPASIMFPTVDVMTRTTPACSAAFPAHHHIPWWKRAPKLRPWYKQHPGSTPAA